MRRTRAVAVALTIAMPLLGAACGGTDEREAPRNPTTTLSPTTLSQAQRDERAVRAAAEGFDRAGTQLAISPDPNSPLLERYLANPLLDAIRANVAQQRDRGIRGRLRSPSRSSYRVESVELQGDRAVVRECVADDGLLYDARTGKVIDDEVVTLEYRTTAERTQQGWRFVDRDTLSKRKGIGGCAKR